MIISQTMTIELPNQESIKELDTFIETAYAESYQDVIREVSEYIGFDKEIDEENNKIIFVSVFGSQAGYNQYQEHSFIKAAREKVQGWITNNGGKFEYVVEEL